MRKYLLCHLYTYIHICGYPKQFSVKGKSSPMLSFVIFEYLRKVPYTFCAFYFAFRLAIHFRIAFYLN